jgi:hypothetical protein
VGDDIHPSRLFKFALKLDLVLILLSVGQLLTLTKPGQSVIAIIIALRVLTVTALRSDPFMAIVLFNPWNVRGGYPPTPNQTVPNAKRTNDYLATGDLFPTSQYKKFSVGHWNVSVEVISDNSAPLLLKGGFTITRDERIEFDKPVALRKFGICPKPFQPRPVVEWPWNGQSG